MVTFAGEISADLSTGTNYLVFGVTAFTIASLLR